MWKIGGTLEDRGRQIYGQVGKIRLHSDRESYSQSKQSKQPLTKEICL